MTHFAHLHHAPLVRQNSSATVSVLVADDHPAVLHGLAGILRSTPDIKVVALCNDGAAAIEAVRKFEPDVAVLDIRMPQVNGLEALPKIINVTKVVLLTATASDTQLLEAIAGGAKGLVLKEYAPDRLIDCIRTVAAGQNWFPPELIDAILKSEAGHKLANQNFGSLTMRERGVVLAVCKGNSNKQVARQMGLSEATVKIHLHNTFKKLGVPNRAALVAFFIAHRQELEAVGMREIRGSIGRGLAEQYGVSSDISEHLATLLEQLVEPSDNEN